MHARLLLASLFRLYSTDFLKAFYQIKWHIKILFLHHNIFCIIYICLFLPPKSCYARPPSLLLKRMESSSSRSRIVEGENKVLHYPATYAGALPYIFTTTGPASYVFVYRELYWLVVSAKSMFYVPFFFFPENSSGCMCCWLLTLVIQRYDLDPARPHRFTVAASLSLCHLLRHRFGNPPGFLRCSLSFLVLSDPDINWSMWVLWCWPLSYHSCEVLWYRPLSYRSCDASHWAGQDCFVRGVSCLNACLI